MSTIEITLAALTIFYCLSIFSLFYGLFRLSPCNNAGEKCHFMTVIVAAHNEEKHLEACLQCIVAQDYPEGKFEVIVADDRSNDNTLEIIKKFVKRYQNFKSVRVESSECYIPKKTALIKGLDIAEGEIIVSTDADCIQPITWLSSMNACFNNDTGLVIGHTAYYRSDNLWKGIDALDYFSHRALGAAFIGIGSSYTSTASNFAYRKELFDSNRETFIQLGVRPAEDNFFVHCARKRPDYSILVATDERSFVTTNGANNFNEFLNQRFRWSAYGGTITTIGVNLFFIPAITFYFLIWISLLLSVVNQSIIGTLLLSILCKSLFDFLFIFKSTLLFKCRYLLRFFIPLSLLHLLLVPVVVIKGNLFSFKWKGRRYTKKAEINTI